MKVGEICGLDDAADFVHERSGRLNIDRSHDLMTKVIALHNEYSSIEILTALMALTGMMGSLHTLKQVVDDTLKEYR